jgi:ankyrin repeat protein
MYQIIEKDSDGSNCQKDEDILESLKSKLRNYKDNLLFNSFIPEFLRKNEDLHEELQYILQHQLHLSIEAGCVSTAEILLKKYGAKISNNKEPFSNSLYLALHYKATSAMIKLLLNNGADVNSVKDEFSRPIVKAIGLGNIEIIKLLLGDERLELNLTEQSYHANANPLYNAIAKNNTEIIKLLLAAKADPNIKLFLMNTTAYNKKLEVSCFATLLDKSIAIQNFYITELLLQHGANPNTPSTKREDMVWSCSPHNNLYPLQKSLENSDVTLTKLLLIYGANPNIATAYPQYQEEYFNFLKIAILQKNADLINLLLEFGANPNGNTVAENPIVIAIKYNEPEIIELFLKHSIKASSSNILNESNLLKAIYAATAANSNKSIELLFSYYKDLDLNNKPGNCALVTAANKNNTYIVQQLLAHNANTNDGCEEDLKSLLSSVNKAFNSISVNKLVSAANTKFNNKKQYALHIATQNDNVEITKMLLTHKADPNQQNYFSEVALRIAVQKSFLNNAELLLKHGANPNYINITSSTTTDVFEISTCFRKNSDTYGILQLAVSKDDFNMSKLLLEYGANPNLKSSYGWLPVVQSVLRDFRCQEFAPNYELAKLLIEHGADPNSKYHSIDLVQIIIAEIKDLSNNANYFRTCINYKSGQASELQSQFCSMIEDLNLEDIFHETEIKKAKMLEFIEFLISKGYRAINSDESYNSLTDSYLLSSLELAVKNNLTGIVQLLLKTEPDQQTKVSALALAIKDCNKDIINMLMPKDFKNFDVTHLLGEEWNLCGIYDF